jgi:exodeoxyribonuclease VII large subunit
LKPIRVSQLNAYIRRVLSSDPVLANVSVAGEISNFKRHNGGHVYFSLRDKDAKVNCFLPGNVYESLPRSIGDGDEIDVTGRIDVYERGGYYSLYIRELAFRGEGGLAAAFEALKAKLLAEGLFDPAVKKPLPAFPRTVALVTSPTGAAIEDMLKIITAKNDVVDILIYPTLVQGPEAAARIAAGIAYVNDSYPSVDVMIVGRGGGSVEDLWAFNEEVVARAIFASKIPVISAVGHETDVTIADFASDVRAETPTAAAGMAVPDVYVVRSGMDETFYALKEGLAAMLTHMRLRMDACAMPRLGVMLGGRIGVSRADTAAALGRLRSGAADALWRGETAAAASFGVLRSGAEDAALRGESAVNAAYERLKASDPARILSMGYAALSRDGRPLRSVTNMSVGDELIARLADGSAKVQVKSAKSHLTNAHVDGNAV